MSKSIRKPAEYAKIAAEQRQKEEQKRFQEQRQAKKNKIAELTSSLATSYAHIRPTNIQGQRILKIFDHLNRRLNIISRLPDLSSCNQTQALPLSVRNQFTRLADLETEILEIFLELQEKREALEALVEEEDEEDADLQKRTDLQELITEKEEALNEAEEQYKEEIQEVSRFLKPAELEALPPLTEKVYGEVPQIFQALYYIYLKRLSTSFEEEQGHKRLLKALQKSISEAQQLEEKTREDLAKLSSESQSEIARKNEEITKLKDELAWIVQNEQDSLRQAEEDSQSKKSQRENEHQLVLSQLTAKISEQKAKLEQTEKLNLDREVEMLRFKEDFEAQITAQITDIDCLKQRENDKLKKIHVC